ncbi:MAG: protein kinase [Anaerolineae bacterium]|nr:protein kinase [Anaerolineae bacterium]
MSTPATIGGYRIIKQIGSGGMATVYEAHQEKLDRRVAIKWMHASFTQDRQFIGRFEREARIVARLDHPNIVPIYDYETQEGRPYLVMKLLDGQTLKDVMAESPLSLPEIIAVMTTVASALDYAHTQGVLHRDLKPSNILIDSAGVAYLTDFGLARITHQGESTLSADSMLGTPHYISPEQALGGKDLDGRTDVYSFGVLLYEMVVGRLPFTADTPYAIVHKHIYAAPPSPSALNPDIPPAVEKVLLKALAKNPPDRYPTATALINDFQKALQNTGVDELDASRIQRAYELGESIVMNTPGGGRYSQVSVVHGRKVIDIPYVPAELVPEKEELSWQEWLQVFIERLKNAIEDIRYQLGNRNIKDRVQTAAFEISDSLRNATDGAVDIQIKGLTPPPTSQTKTPTKQQGRIQAAAPVPRRNIRALQEDWGTDEDYVRRRVKKRINDRRGLIGHIAMYVIAMAVAIPLNPTIQAGIQSFFTTGILEFVDQATATALAPLAGLPVVLLVGLGWGAGVISHILDVFYRSGRRQERKRELINREMTDLYGEYWRETVTDSEYRPIREWVRRRFSRRLGFMKHAVHTVANSINLFMVLPILSALILNLTADAFLAQLPVLIFIIMAGALAVHGAGVILGEMFDTGHEREIQKEIAKEKERLGLGETEKAKNTLSTIDKRKRISDNDIELRLTEDGELSESLVLELTNRNKVQ